MEEKKKVVKVMVKKKADNGSCTENTPTPSTSNKTAIPPTPENNNSTSNHLIRNLLIVLGAIALIIIILLFGTRSNRSDNTTTSLEQTTNSTTITTTTTTIPTTTAPQISETEYYYNEVTSLDIYDLEKKKSPSGSDRIFYYYKGLILQTEDTEWLLTSWNKNQTVEAGAPYRSVATLLVGFSKHYNDGSSFCKILTGKPLTSREAFEPYANNAMTFITQEDALQNLSKKLLTITCVQGTLDYEKRNFHFDIEDVQKCAQEMMISEEMLGYCFGIFNEYGASINFDGNKCTIDRQS